MKKDELYNLIENLNLKTDKYAVGIHLYGSLKVDEAIELFKERTGKYPAFVDFDMHSLPFVDPFEIDTAIKQLVEFSRKGGFVTLTDHWLTPTVNYRNATCKGANNSFHFLTREQYYAVITEGTELNKNFTDELHIAAGFIKKLEKQNVPVIFRPLHEGNGEWFWWSINNANSILGEDVAALFKYVHNFFVNKQGINNILWQFNTAMAGSKTDFVTWYPGDEYVDLISTDWYLPVGDLTNCFHVMEKLGSKKPFAVSEFGGDGNYPMENYKLTDSQHLLEAHIDNGCKVSYLGFYFDMPSGQDWSLSSYSITLEDLSRYRQ